MLGNEENIALPSNNKALCVVQRAFVVSRGSVLEASRRKPIRHEAVVGEVHVRAAVEHVPVVRDGIATGRSRPPLAVVTDIVERRAIVEATGQGGKAVGVRANIGAPQGAIGLECGACGGGTAYVGFQRVPSGGVGQVPACGAGGQCGRVIVQASVGGTVAGRIAVTPTIATGGLVVQVLRHPSLRANHHSLVGLTIARIVHNTIRNIWIKRIKRACTGSDYRARRNRRHTRRRNRRHA